MKVAKNWSGEKHLLGSKAMEKWEGIENWSERVEDMLHEAEVDSAISLLESVIETLNPSSDRVSQLQLASALSDLANLYSSKGLSVKSQDLQSRAFLIKQLHHSNSAYFTFVLHLSFSRFLRFFPPSS